MHDVDVAEIHEIQAHGAELGHLKGRCRRAPGGKNLGAWQVHAKIGTVERGSGTASTHFPTGKLRREGIEGKVDHLGAAIDPFQSVFKDHPG